MATNNAIRHPLAEHLLPDMGAPPPFDWERVVYICAALAVVVGVARLFT